MGDIPNYYSKLGELLEKEDDNIIGQIAYALYITFYEERQAFVSQTVMQLNKLNPSHDLIPREEWGNYIKNTDSYKILLFVKNLSIFLKTLTIENKNTIVKTLNDYGIEITNFDKMVNDMYQKSNISFRNVTRNAMIYFRELENKYKKNK